MRRLAKQNLSLQQRLAAWSRELRDQADRLLPGPERDVLLAKANQAESYDLHDVQVAQTCADLTGGLAWPT
jgi:hypothetical protein